MSSFSRFLLVAAVGRLALALGVDEAHLRLELCFHRAEERLELLVAEGVAAGALGGGAGGGVGGAAGGSIFPVQYMRCENETNSRISASARLPSVASSAASETKSSW